MAKRFTGTDIWSQDWFLDMPNEYKLFWDYILCECDHAGLYKVNVKSFGRLIQETINADKALEFFNFEKERIRVIKPNLWFVEDFISFQYGTQLNPANRVHNSILRLLGQVEVKLRSIRGLKGVNDGVKDKDKDNNKEIGNEPREEDIHKFIPPTLEEVKNYFAEKYYAEHRAEAMFEYYTNRNWINKDDKPVVNWKLTACSVWFKDEYKIEKPSDATLQKEKHIQKLKKIYFKNGKFSYKGVESTDLDSFRRDLYMKNVDLYLNTK